MLEEVAGDVADDDEEHEVLEEQEGVLQVAEQGVGLQDEETRVEAVAVNIKELLHKQKFFTDTETELSNLSQGAS